MNKPASELIALADIPRLIETLEAYGFACEAGPLTNCGEWRHLKRLAATAQPAPTTTHGKPDGAVRERVAEAIQNLWQGPSGRTWAECQEKLPPQADWFRKLADVAIASLHSPKIAAAETSPGDVLAMKEACDLISFPRWWVQRIYDDLKDAELPIGPLGDWAFLFREQLKDKIAAAIDRLDVKAEAKSQEPDAVAWRCFHCGFVAKTELEAINHFGKTMDFQSACQGEGGQWAQRLRRHVRSLLNGIETGAVKIETEQDETLERDLSFMRFAIDHYEAQKPTTKPEAPAVSVDAIKDIAAERKRQWHVEGWSPSHDDTHKHGELAKAAACYAVGYIIRGHTVSLTRTNSWSLWSWDLEWWKPKDRRRNLVRAGALIVAEIERLDRAALIAGGR